MSLSNIDNLLMSVEPEVETIAKQPEPVESSYIDTTPAESSTEPEHDEKAPTASTPETEPETAVDDYGTPVEKKERLYTEEEKNEAINQAIRKRLREEHESRPAQQPVQQHTEAQPSDENWEQQLESFVEQTLSKREQKLQEQQWQQIQAQQQAEFEVKFNTGAAKYADFEHVVVGKPLTPQMVIATRGMNDPAAFIYAAAKTQAHELERISKIADPYAQAVELGKLDERMKRGKAAASNAPKPISQAKGDAPERSDKRPSVDDILRHEDQKRLRGRR